MLLFGLGAHFASDTKEVLIEQSHGHLKSLIRDSGLLVQQNFQLIDWVLAGQVQEIELRFRERENSHSSQDISKNNLKIISNNSETTLTEANLKSLSEGLQQLKRKAPDLILRQYIAFTSGRSYFLPSGQIEIIPVDLSDQEWLAKTFQSRAIIRTLVNDPQRHSLNLVIGVPLQTSDGATWGVTAVEVSLSNLMSPIKLPGPWRPGARVMLASMGGNAEKVSIVAQAISDSSWQFPSEPSALDPVLLEASLSIKAAVEKVRSGILMVEHQDRIRHWAYGSLLWGKFFPLVMLEHDKVVSFAIESEQHVLGKTRLGVVFVVIGLLVFVGLSIIAAGHFSQAITEPVRILSSAFNQLAKGDFSERVSIETGDEIEELGHNFNDLGGKLEDRNRMADSLALAREVQQHLLPRRPPVVSGMDLFSRGIPCDEIGGDYYDFISLNNTSKAQLGIVVGDVSGHGVPAALLMASARGILRSHAWCHGGDLTFLFQLLNHQFAKDSAHDHFMTLFYGILDREMKTLCWNSAGHGPVFLYQSQSQRLKELETTGPPLGIDENLRYEPQVVRNLEPGDFLLAGTDGLWESRDQSGECWGVEMFKSKLLRVKAESASEIGQFLFTELSEFRGEQKQEDDISLVVAKIT